MRRLTVFLSLLLLASACKKKPPPPPPKPDLPISASGFSVICEGTKKSFSGVKPYSKSTPNNLVIFAKDLDDKNKQYEEQHPKLLDGWSADNRVKDASLIACIDAKPQAEEAFTCSYYGASVKLHTRDYQLRIIEAATGNVLVDTTFTADARMFTCPSTVNGNKNWYIDYDRRLYGEVFALQPPTSTPIKETPNELYAVCSGTPVPSAGKPRTGGAVKLVYFNDDKASFSSHRPDGFPDLKEDKDIENYTTVVCVTAKPGKKTQSCDFYDKTLELHEGDFEVVVREAKTAKIVETKTFTGKAGYCPNLYTFDGASKKVWISSIDKSFQSYIDNLVDTGNP